MDHEFPHHRRLTSTENITRGNFPTQAQVVIIGGIYRDGIRIGEIKSGNYRHTLGGAVGLGPIHNETGVAKEYLQEGQFEIEVVGVRYPAKASLRPLYDPKNEKVKR